MAVMRIPAALDARTSELPEVADPSQVAPKDARQLSRLFFEQVTVLEEGTPGYSYASGTLIEMETGSTCPDRTAPRTVVEHRVDRFAGIRSLSPPAPELRRSPVPPTRSASRAGQAGPAGGGVRSAIMATSSSLSLGRTWSSSRSQKESRGRWARDAACRRSRSSP